MEIGARPHIYLEINGARVKALVDSGANVSLLHDRFLKMMHNKPVPNMGPTYIRDANSGRAYTLGRFELEVRGKELCTRANFHLLANMCSDAILGTDFLRRHNGVVDFEKNTVSFQGKQEPVSSAMAASAALHTEFSLRPSRKFRVPDGKTIMCSATIQTKSDMVFKPGATVLLLAQPNAHLHMVDGLYTVQSKNVVKFPIRNIGFSPVKLSRRDNLLGVVAQSVRDLDLTEATPATVAALVATGLPPPGCKALPGPCPSDKAKYIMSKLSLAEVDPKWRQSYLDWALRNHDVFSGSKLQIGHAPHYEHTVHMRTREPVYVPQFRIPYEHQAILDEFVKTMLRSNVIVECHSQNNVPIFLVNKPKSEGKRVVLDFRRLNQQVFTDKYSILDVRECLNAVGKVRPTVFSGLDLSSAFYQLSLAKEAQPLTAFTLPHTNKQYMWRRAPMGLAGSPASFSRLLHVVLADLGEEVTTYIDDILCASRGHVGHIELLGRVAARLRLHGLMLNPEKTILGRKGISWLGFFLSAGGISPDRDKLRAIEAMMPPETIRQVQQYLGLFNYFRWLVENFSIIARPLSILTAKKSPWRGKDKDGPLPREAEQAFRTLQQRLCSSPVVGYPILGVPYVISVDAALGSRGHPGGIGAVLTQKQHGQEVVISYYSRTLRDHELNYTCFATELLAAEQALLHFSQFIKGSRTTVYVDHKPVASHSVRQEKTISVLQEKISQYEAEVVYRKGELNGAADCLSRMPLPAVAALDVDPPEILSRADWKAAQMTDPVLVSLVCYVQDQVLPEDQESLSLVRAFGPLCVLLEGLLHLSLVRPGRVSKTCLLVPRSKRLYVMRLCHGSKLQGHWGLERTIENILREYFWFQLASDVAVFVRQCDVCQRIDDPNALRTRTELHPWPQATRLFQRVHCDLVGPLKSSGPYKYIIAFICAFSKFVILRPLESKDTKEVAQVFFEHFLCIFSTPKELVSDRGGEFSSLVLRELMKLIGVRKHMVSALNPQANGQVEIFNKSLKKFLRCFVNELTDDWVPYLPALQLAHNTSVSKSTYATPHSLVFGQEPAMPWSLQLNTYSQSDAAVKYRLLQHARNLAVERNEEARKAYARYYNQKASLRRFAVGDKILVHYPSPPPGINPKLYRPWRGIFLVDQVHGNDAYTVVKPGGRPTKVKAARMKLYHEMDDPDDQKVDLSLDDPEDSLELLVDVPDSGPPKANVTLKPSGSAPAGQVKPLPSGGPSQSLAPSLAGPGRVAVQPSGRTGVPAVRDSLGGPVSAGEAGSGSQGSWLQPRPRQAKHRPARDKQARPVRTVMTRSMTRQAPEKHINAGVSAQHCSVMAHPSDDADIDILVLRTKVKFRQYLLYIHHLGFTINVYGQVVKVPEGRDSNLPSIVSGSVVPSSADPSFRVAYIPTPLSGSSVSVAAAQEDTSQDGTTQTSSKGGWASGKAKSSTKFRLQVENLGQASGSSPPYSRQRVRSEGSGGAGGSASAVSSVSGPSTPPSRESSLVTAESGGSGTSKSAGSGNRSGTLSNSQIQETTLQGSPTLEERVAGIAQTCQLPTSSFWANYCVSAAKTVVPQVFQTTEVAPATAAERRPDTRYKGKPPGHFDSKNQIFKPNPGFGHDTQ